jgi:LmbE family N-acetylglucosaminyl deacetylase
MDLLDLIKKVEAFIQSVKPDIIYTHHFGDLNVDHRRVNEAVVTACRPMPGNQVQTLLSFEVLSSTEWQTPSANNAFAPNWYVDISDTLDLKKEALGIYSSELRSWPHPRSFEGIQHLAQWRGTCVGLNAAEAFVLGRKINLKYLSDL